jgi:hypothetical protein
MMKQYLLMSNPASSANRFIHGDLQDGIPFADQDTKNVEFLSPANIERDLIKIKEKLEKVLQKVDKVGQYGLSEISLSVGVTAGVLALTVEGGVTLTFSKNSS